MRLIQLLPLCAATTVVATEPSAAHIVDPSTDSIQELLGVCKGPLCTGADSSETQSIIQETKSKEKELAASLWPISTPCGRNGTKEYCVYADPKFAGRGIAILTSPSRAIDIAKSEPFTDSSALDDISDLNADESPRWRVDEVPGKGMGLTATRNLEMGDHIMSTSASIMIDYDLFYDVSEVQLLQMQVDAVNYLPDKHRTTFLNLSTHDGASDFQQQVSKVIQTNSFDIQEMGLIKKIEGEEENFYTVFPEISRMNHDCRPNADYHFDPETYTQHIHAIRPIMAGEEITISYIDPVQSRHDRLKRLNHSWGFPCSCSLCTQNKHQTAASDARVHQMIEVRKQLKDWEGTSQATPAMAELLISLYEMDRMWSMLYEGYTFAAIEYNGVGEPWLASKYARLAVHHGLAGVGPRDSDVVEMKALARDPWSHWSWMTRTKRRMNWYPLGDD